MAAWRLIDTGPQTPAWHAACDAALFEAKRGGLSPDALVFSSFDAPCVRVGAHQLESDLDLPACRAKGIDLHRRATGGPAIFVDARQLVFNLLVSRKKAGADFSERVNGAVAHALQQVGYPAEARARGPELDAKKVGWITSAADDDALFVQGHLYVHAEMEELSRILPTKPAIISLFDVGAGAAPSREDLRQALVHAFAERFEIAIDSGELTNEERALLVERIPAMRRENGLAAVRVPEGVTSETTVTTKGVILRATVLHGDERNKLRRVLFSGDFSAHPEAFIRDLSAALENSDINEAPGLIEDFFEQSQGEVPGMGSGDFFTALSLAFMKRRVALSSAPDPAAWKKQVQ